MDQLYSEVTALSRYNYLYLIKCVASQVLFIYRCRHQNLVELMGVCSSPPILIYEFMEKGSLYTVLHKVHYHIGRMIRGL